MLFFVVLIVDPVLVVDMTLTLMTNGINTFSVFDFFIDQTSPKKVIFSFFTCQTSTTNQTRFPLSYGSKRMNRDESTKKMLAGSYNFQVDDLEVFVESN